MREHKDLNIETLGGITVEGIFMPRQSDVLAKYIRDGGIFFVTIGLAHF